MELEPFAFRAARNGSSNRARSWRGGTKSSVNCLLNIFGFLMHVPISESIKPKTERTEPTGEGHPEPLNGLLNMVARLVLSER